MRQRVTFSLLLTRHAAWHFCDNRNTILSWGQREQDRDPTPTRKTGRVEHSAYLQREIDPASSAVREGGREGGDTKRGWYGRNDLNARWGWKYLWEIFTGCERWEILCVLEENLWNSRLVENWGEIRNDDKFYDRGVMMMRWILRNFDGISMIMRCVMRWMEI